MIEIEEKLLWQENSIYCIVETQKVRHNIHVKHSISYISKVRSTKDKGGGISIYLSFEIF